MKNIKMNHAVDGKYEILHPETNLKQVIDSTTGKSLETILSESTNIRSIANPHFVVVATGENQTVFPFNDTLFDKYSTVKVFMNGELLHPDEEYTVNTSDSSPRIVLRKGVHIGTQIFIDVMRMVITETGENVLNGATIIDNSISEEKLNPVLTTLYVDSSNGDDSNDGLSTTTPLRSIAMLNEKLSNLKLFYVHVVFAPGEYKGTVVLDGMNSVTLRTNGDSGKAIFTEPLSGNTVLIYIHNTLNVNISGNITFKPSGVNIIKSNVFYPVFASNCKILVIERGVVFDGSNFTSDMHSLNYTIALRADFSHLVNSARFRGFDSGIYSDGSHILDRDSVYETPTDHNLQLGAIYTRMNSDGNNDNPPTIIDSYNTSLDIRATRNGIIIESGSNSNGSYLKYADGTLICISNMVSFGLSDIPTEIPQLFKTEQVPWAYPMQFMDVPVINVSPLSGSGHSWGALSNRAVENVSCAPILVGLVRSDFDNVCRITAIGRWK